MSLPGKEARFQIDPELHEHARAMAEFYDRDLGGFMAQLLEKAIVGEWHAFRLVLSRANRIGNSRRLLEKGGKGDG